jgi:hypothetical protein
MKTLISEHDPTHPRDILLLNGWVYDRSQNRYTWKKWRKFKSVCAVGIDDYVRYHYPEEYAKMKTLISEGWEHNPNKKPTHARDILLSYGWKYDPSRLEYSQVVTDNYTRSVHESSVDEYVSNVYPVSYAKMKNDVELDASIATLVTSGGILGSKVADLGITVREQGKRINSLEVTSAVSHNEDKSHTVNRTYYESRLKEARDTIYRLQKKMRGVASENESLRHEIYFGDHSDKAMKRAKDTVNSHFARICELKKDLDCERSDAASYRSESDAKIKELESLLTEADKCLIKHGEKSRDQSDTIVRMHARLDEANDEVRRTCEKVKKKIARLKDLCNRSLRYNIPSGLYREIKEELL